MQNITDPELRRDLQILRDGISAEALAVLKKRYGFEQPLFDHSVMTSAEGNDKFFRMALIKEGQRQVISFIILSSQS